MNGLEYQILENIPKSISDKRLYHYKVLENGLKVLLISDAEADKSAASLSVNVGSICEPDEYPGLAHFCEHMLFMGTEKFPDENEFSEFLNLNSGESNAFTTNDVTNYHFKVANSSFNEALDMFAQFFIKPLFNKDSVEQEMKAVDSEYKKEFQSDSTRFEEILNCESNPKSPFRRFSMGSLETLKKPKIRKALIEFHSAFYSSDLMALAVLSNQSLGDLNTLVDELFSGIKKLDKVQLPDLITHQRYNADNLGFLYKMIPTSEDHSLVLYWVLDAYKGSYKDCTLEVLCDLLEYDERDSLSFSLVEDKLAVGLSTSFEDQAYKSSSVLIIDITLTDEGLRRWEEVMKRVFYFIKKYQNNPISREYFETNKYLEKIYFDYQNKEDPYDYCAELSQGFFEYEPQDILTGSLNYTEFKEEVIKNSLNKLTSANLNVYLLSKTFKCDLIEPWYQTKYSKENFKENLEKTFSQNLENEFKLNFLFPRANEHINRAKEDFAIKGIDLKKEFPEKIYQSERSEIWFKQDYTFLLPKAIIVFKIYQTNSTFYLEKDLIFSTIWESIVYFCLREYIYKVAEAGVNLTLNRFAKGIYIEASGFNKKMKTLLPELIKRWKEIKYEDYRKEFETQIENITKQCKNFSYWKSYDVASEYLSLLNVTPTVTYKEKLRLLSQEINFEDFLIFARNFSTLPSEVSNYINVYAQGNITEQETLDIYGECISYLQKPSSVEIDKTKYLSWRHVNIPEKSYFYFCSDSEDLSSENSSILSYFQLGNLSLKEKSIMAVIVNIFTESFFDELRTNQALGYIVTFSTINLEQVSGFTYLVQSSEKSPEYIVDKINEFIVEGLKEIEEMDEETFSSNIDSVVTDLSEKDLMFYEEAYRCIGEIAKKTNEFDFIQKKIKFVEELTKQEVLDFYREKVIKNFKRLDIEIISVKHKAENEKFEHENNYKIKNFTGIERVKVHSKEEYQRRLQLYPDLYISN